MGCLAYSSASLLHLFTTFIAFSSSGFVAGAATFFLPVLSEIYWVFRLGLFSGYGLLVLGWTVLLLLGFGGMALGAALDREPTPDYSLPDASPRLEPPHQVGRHVPSVRERYPVHESDPPEAPGLFRQPSLISPAEVDALAGLRPLEDPTFGYLLGRALEGKVPAFLAAVPLSLLEPFDKHYHPELHSVGRAAIEDTINRAIRGQFSILCVYPRDGRYVVADDYIPYAAARRGNPELVHCCVLGDERLPGVEAFKGPLSQNRLRELLGL